MGKLFGIISLVSGIIGFTISPLIINTLLTILTSGWVSYFAVPLGLRFLLLLATLVLAGTGIVCGGIGIAKDDSKGLAIAGLIISSIAMIISFAGSFNLIFGA